MALFTPGCPFPTASDARIPTATAAHTPATPAAVARRGWASAAQSRHPGALSGRRPARPGAGQRHLRGGGGRGAVVARGAFVETILEFVADALRVVAIAAVYAFFVQNVAKLIFVFWRSPEAKKRPAAPSSPRQAGSAASRGRPPSGVTQRVFDTAADLVDECSERVQTGSVDRGAAYSALRALLRACALRAPRLVKSHEVETLLPVARVASWLPRRLWVRAPEDWQPAPGSGLELRALLAHLLELYQDAPEMLRWGPFYTDGPECSEAAQRSSWAITQAYAAAGRGESVRTALQKHVCADVGKAVAKAVVQLPAEELKAAEGHPLRALRRAQAWAFGGADWLRSAVSDCRLAERIGTPQQEAFALSAVRWACQQEDALQEPRSATQALDYAVEMHNSDNSFTCAGKTAKSMMQAVDSYRRSTVTFTDGEQFKPNFEGIQGMFLQGATIPGGTTVYVPYDRTYTIGSETEPATVRIAEILSWNRLIYEGRQLGNCLEDNFMSQAKYVTRARDQSSSFWSMTILREDGEVEHVCLIEVWHLRYGNVVHQAEGPRPRTLPSFEAWFWLERWCERQNLDLSEWNCYS